MIPTHTGVKELDGVLGLDGLEGLDLFASLPDPVVVIDLDFRVVWGSPAAEARFGWRSSELRGRSAVELIHPDDVAFAAASLVSVQARAVGTPIEVRVRDASGLYGRFEVLGRATGQVVVLVLRDITERRCWEVAGGDATLLQAIIDSAPAVTLLLDLHGGIRGASRALMTILGHDVEHVLGLSLASLAADEDMSSVGAELAVAAGSSGTRSFEARFRRSDGASPVPMNVTVVNLGDDQAVQGLVVTAVDIGPLFEARAQLEQLATHDPLTGLLNRTPFRDRLEDALADGQPGEATVTVLFCDVDRFKRINDEYGHAAGDAVLMAVARRLHHVVRSEDIVARFGGDEFVILAARGDTDGLAHGLAQRIRDVMSQPIQLSDGTLLSVSVSVGAATSATASDGEALLRAADAAMYEAKNRGRVLDGGAAVTTSGAPPIHRDVLDELMAKHAHDVLQKMTTTLGALQLMLTDGHRLGTADRQQVLNSGVDAALTIRDDLRAMIAGILVDLASAAASSRSALRPQIG